MKIKIRHHVFKGANAVQIGAVWLYFKDGKLFACNLGGPQRSAELHVKSNYYYGPRGNIRTPFYIEKSIGEEEVIDIVRGYHIEYYRHHFTIEKCIIRKKLMSMDELEAKAFSLISNEIAGAISRKLGM